MRIGMIGLDSSHAEHFVRHFNLERDFGEARIEAVCGTDPERARYLAEVGRVPMVVNEPTALLGRVDAVIVGDRDGRLHRSHALPFLTAGLPVLIDKPLTVQVSDAVRLVDAAEQHHAPVTSFSALRWAAGLEMIRAAVKTTPPPHVLLATGPADVASPWGGLSYYGVHMVEAALEVVSGAIGDVTAFACDGSVVATTTIGKIRVVFTFVPPTRRDAVPYHLQLVSRDQIVGSELTLADNYLRPVMEMFVDMITTGRPPLPYTELLAPVVILDKIASSLEPVERSMADRTMRSSLDRAIDMPSSNLRTSAGPH